MEIFGKKKQEEEVKIEISKEEWETLKIIAQRVGGDFGMEIKIGKPGQGSFFNPKDPSITLDPLNIKENPEQAKFIAAHEGAHRAITPDPKEIGLSEEQIKKYYSQIGFRSLQNYIEDPAVNNWMGERFPGLKEYIKKVYDEQLKEEGAVLFTPEVTRIAAQLGYWPKFAQYGSEIIRDWHQGRFSKKLNPAVEKALKRTIDDARKSIKTIPDPGKPARDREEILATARERFRINTEYIWPEVKKLVEMDLHTEELRQMMKDFRQKQKELEEKRKELKKARDQGDKQKVKKLQDEIEKLTEELDPFNNLPEKVKKELQEKIDKAIREIARELNGEIEDLKKQIESAKQKQKELEKEIKDLEEKVKRATGKEKEKLEKQIQEKKAEKLSQEVKQKQAEEELKQIQETLEKIESDQGMPYPEDKLSEETKRELENLFKNLPLKKQRELRERAEEQLEDFEDVINRGMEGKLNKDKPESHRERREREEREKKIKEEKRKADEELKKLEKKLEEMRREKMTEYDKTYEEVADIINRLYIRLKKFFLPERHPKWKNGYPSGQRVDLLTAMQAEADPRYLGKIWERKTIPHKLDYRLSLLIDTSGSMTGEKIEETFKGLVVLIEVLEKLGIQYQVIAFSDSAKVFKDWYEKLDNRKRNYLSQIKEFENNGTATTEATEKAYQEFLKNLGKNNFLITFTDGQPNDPEPLKELLKEIEKEGRIKLVGVGLGPDTEFVKEFYKASFSIPQVKITAKEHHKGKKDFAEAFADLLEDMIKHPEKY
ncbi:MAG: VWA domain-containing protein [Candidatus Aenigmatarchaeota archaeon]